MAPMDDSTDFTFDEFLEFDPLLAAEELTGKRYDDEDTAALGVGLHLMYQRAKEQELGLRGDSYHRIGYQDYLAIVEDLGFDLIFQEDFTPQGYAGETDTPREQYRVYWRAGLLLTAESYRGDTLNSATLYFNAEFPDSRTPFTLHLSGHLHGEAYDHEKRYVWIGQADAREAIRHTVAQLEDRAQILPNWIEQPFLWLMNYGEKRVGTEDYAFITNAKVAEFPAAIREAVTAPQA